MTLEQLIALEAEAVSWIEAVHGQLGRAKRNKLLAAMRLFSINAQRGPMPNSVDPRGAALQVRLRALDLAGISSLQGHYQGLGI